MLCRLLTCLSLFIAIAATADAAGPPSQDVVLDVPYLAQPPELCGGAAVSMVMRYWGEDDVFPEDFARFVTERDRGILTGVLAGSVQTRGWRASTLSLPPQTARDAIRSELGSGRPLIALIEVGDRVYHYVVVLGTTATGVILHDPARGPFRVLSWPDFEARWNAAERWMMRVLPPEAYVPPSRAAVEPEAAVSRSSCRPIVDSGVQLALAGNGAEAEQALTTSTMLCPDDPVAWRELAGLRFTSSRWTEAADLARRSLALDPSDTLSWQLLATARYLSGQTVEALAAWNRVGEPRADTINVHGADRTRHPIVVKLIAIEPRQLITPELFSRAVRRAGTLPAASATRLVYEPLDGGRARVDAHVSERRVWPTDVLSLAELGARAAFRDEIHGNVAGPLGEGEVWSATWRWVDRRPRVAFDVAFPALGPFSGIATIEASLERQTYGLDAASEAGSERVEARRRVAVSLADWATSRLWWRGSVALDRFDARDYLSLGLGIDYRLAGDLVSLSGSSSAWGPLRQGNVFGTANVTVAWRSTRAVHAPSWSAHSTVAVSSVRSPLAVWSGAGSGTGRGALLRAHPLLDDDVVRGAVFGRRLTQGSVEYARPFLSTPFGSIGIALFMDAAKAWRRHENTGASPLHVDGGGGLRVRLPATGGTIRLDVARGFRDGATAVSVGWQPFLRSRR